LKTIATIVLVALCAIPQAAGGNTEARVIAEKDAPKIRKSKKASAWVCPDHRRGLAYYRLARNKWLLLRGVDTKMAIEQPRACTSVLAKVKQARADAWAARKAYYRYLDSFTYKGSNPNVRLGQMMARPYGWHVGYQWDALYELWNRESGWNHRAYNPSGACGIPQAMNNCNGYDPRRQIEWGLRYIKGRYGDPANAYAFFLARNWY
jgi:hypothetical protein